MNTAFSIFIKSEQARRALLKKLEEFGYIYLKFWMDCGYKAL